ncbi:MAG: flagellar hook-associated protein FlgK [Ruminococcus sp.]|nr:flagellar hook-associated protein FlgK [Ruminococcus sp.]
MSMRPTFMGFESSKSAIFASQKALDIVGHNLANMTTEGYTRQRLDQVSVDNYAYNSRKANASYNHIGIGTRVEGIAQVRDERMDTSFRNSYSDTSYYSKGYEMFSEIETIISEIDIGVDGDGYGLSWGMKEMYGALEELSNNVNIDANTTIFADAVYNVTVLLNNTASTLDEACESYRLQLQTETKDVNSFLEEVASLNKQISGILAGGGYTEQYGPNELIDKRNVILDKLSAFGKLDVAAKSDGTVDVSLNGHKCVKGTVADSIVYTANKDETVSLTWKSNSENAATENGSLKASSEVINGRGVNADGSVASDARGFKYYIDSLDSFAVRLAEVLNNTVPETFDENGNILTYKKLVGECIEENGETVIYNNRKVTAANITISDELYSDPTYVLTDKNSSDNTYLLNLIGKLSKDEHDINNGAESFRGTFQEFISNYAGKIGSDVYNMKSRYESCEKYSNELQDTRENVTAVSESEETVSMLTYNRAFQAAAKMMTTMDELLDVIINQVGALG